MAQADYVISPNPTGLAMREEINQIFQAALTSNSGSTAPTTTAPYSMWVDTSNGTTHYLKMRNHTNDAWVSIASYDVTTKTIKPTSLINVSTDNAIVRFDGTSGQIQNSGVVIDDNGNVGIGTSSPDCSLEVVGDSTTVKISNNNTGPTSTALQIGGYSGTTSGIYGTVLRSIHNFGLTSASSFAFELAGSERMRIDSNGNVGIGVTPSAWYTEVKAQQIGSQGSVFQDQNNNIGIGKNTYKSGASAYNYIVSDYASLYFQGAGQHQWYTAPSGTAGNVITWTNAMTLDNSGNLLVGVASDTSTPNNGVTIRNSGGTVGNIGVGHASGTTTGVTYQTFAYAGTQIGSIYQSGTTAVVFSTTSDYRLKENIRPADCKKFMDIKFVDYERIDGRHECGVIAHELQEIYPDLVIGEKDATEIRKVEISPAIEEVKDEDGNIITEAVEAVYEEQEFPVYQQVNYIGLIARIGTVVQQQAKLIDELKSRIETLESK